MSPRRSKAIPTGLSVFLNCPFDEEYRRIFEAIVFTVHVCGFTCRCALEETDAATVRIEKIVGMIRACDFGIHDLSRVDTHGKLPRFNMPLELGLFLGAQRFGRGRQKKKRCLILEGEKFQYQRFISDIAGQDLAAHGANPEEAVSAVRKFLSDYGPPESRIPGRNRIVAMWKDFTVALPGLLLYAKQDRESMTFKEFRSYVAEFVAALADT
jgi:hypothetical protein